MEQSQSTLLADGRYRLIRAIGRNTLSTSFEGEYVGKGKVFIRKFVRAPETNETAESWGKHFLRTAQLKHPNLVRLLDFGRDDNGARFAILEWCELDNLAERIKQSSPLPLPVLGSALATICSALDYMHQNGQLHRRITSRAIFLSDEGIGKLTDLDYPHGLEVQLTQDQCQPVNDLGSKATYFSPEQCMGKPLTAASDVYSLAICAFEAIAGRPPFRGSSSIKTASMHFCESVPSLSEVRADLGNTDDLDIVLRKALEKNPSDRFQTAVEFGNALNQ